MSEQDKPLPCPFCGHTGLAFCEGSTFRWLAYSCGSCGIGSETRMQTSGKGTPEEWRKQAEQDAIAALNTRPAPPAPPVAEPALPEQIPPLGTPASARDIVQTIALALKNGYTPDEILDENSPIFERICAEAAIAADRAARPVLTPAKAVYAFASWLTCRDESVTFGSTHNAAIAADLVDAFCKSQDFEPPRNDWADGIKPYPVAAATQGSKT